MNKRKKRLIAGCTIITGVAVLFWIQSSLGVREPIRVLEKNPPGEGSRDIHMEFRTDKGSFPVDFQLEERGYRDEELEKIFDKGCQWLDTVWLGDNTSAQEVFHDLNFPTSVESLGLAIRWETESYRWIQTDGTITNEARELAPLDVMIRAVLSYGEKERIVEYPVRILPPEKDENTLLQESVVNALENLQAKQKTEEYLVLPENIGAMSLTWYDREKPLCPKVFVFGNLCWILLYFCQEERRMQHLKDREEELQRDYPEIVYRLVLLIGSGLTVRAAWEKITSDYQHWRERTGKSRWGYDEMEMTVREMNYGIPELKAYESFGQRCRIQGYVRLSSLLIQQVRRGAQGMNTLLVQEISEAEVLRREIARKSAEEAGNRLILPMVLLMTVVFAVLMIPAFLSINL